MKKSNLTSRSKPDWMYELLEKYQNSDQTQKKFCKTEGVSVGILQYWRRKDRAQKAQADKWIPLDLCDFFC